MSISCLQSFAAISDAIASLKVSGSRKGVSRSAIKGALGDVSAARVNVGLKKAVAAGKLTKTGDSYKVVAVKKAAAKAAPKTKAATKKKAAPKKKKATKKKATAKKATKKKTTKKKKSAKKK